VRAARAGTFGAGRIEPVTFDYDLTTWPDPWIAADLLTYGLETVEELEVDTVIDAENAITAKPVGQLDELLDRAEEATGADRIAALEAAWRACFAPELADAIEAADAAIVTPPLKEPKKKSELEKVWAAAAATASPKAAFAGTWPSKWKDAQRRMRVFYGRPRSPLLAAAASEFALQDAVPYTSIASQKFWQAFAWFIAEQCDVRQLDSLAALEARIGKFHGRTTAVATDALRAWERPALSDKVRARIAKLAVAKPKKHAALSLASADERSVAADQLLQAGDPRGEFITVQEAIAKKPTPELVKRQVQLLKKHAKAWCPPGVYRDSCVFRHGVPVAGHLMPRSDSELESFIGSKALATFETLLVDGANAMGPVEDETIAAVVRSLPNLRHAIVTDGAAELLASGEPTALEQLTADGAKKLKLDGPGLPKLVRLNLEDIKHGTVLPKKLAELGTSSAKLFDTLWREKRAPQVTLCELGKFLHRHSASGDTPWELVVKLSAMTARPLAGSTAKSLTETLASVKSWAGVTMLRVPENFVEAVEKLAKKTKVPVKTTSAFDPATLGISLELA
jgi:hypothetical protein